MNGKVLVALVVGVCLGFAAALLLRQPQVSAADAAQKWEYKAVQLQESGGGFSASQLDEVNKEGYEFVAMSSMGGPEQRGVVVIFKRSKK